MVIAPDMTGVGSLAPCGIVAWPGIRRPPDGGLYKVMHTHINHTQIHSPNKMSTIFINKVSVSFNVFEWRKTNMNLILSFNINFIIW